MNVLFIAFACNPLKGSEAQCGWAWAEAMRHFHDVHILTRNENKIDIEQYLNKKGIYDVHVHYCDIPNSINLYYKKHMGYLMYYVIWQRVVYRTVKRLHKLFSFDVIHHVTLGDYRIVGKLWKIDTKFVFGPVGGAQLTPGVFDKYIDEYRLEEEKRRLINKIFTSLPRYRKAINKAAKIYVANEETQKSIQSLMENPSKCELLSENGVTRSYLDSISSVDRRGKKVITLMWSGRIVYRKGLMFLLDVLEKVETNIPWKMIIVGDGPQKNILKKRTLTMNNGEKIQFIKSVNYEGMKQYYQMADIFVFPSLRETTGTVLFEAMSNRLPVISFKQNGAKLLVDKNTGILIDVNVDSLKTIQIGFINAIKTLIEDEQLRHSMGEAGYQKILKNYVWENKVKQVIYVKGTSR